MGMRRLARERAVQFLFQFDLNPVENLDAALDHFWASQEPLEEIDSAAAQEGQDHSAAPNAKQATLRLFSDKLIRGTLEHKAEIDAIISKHAEHWNLDRIAVVDRNVLRLAIHEMMHRDDIPPVVSINEAVDIAKKFSTRDSGKFVNGILDRIKADLMRPLR